MPSDRVALISYYLERCTGCTQVAQTLISTGEVHSESLQPHVKATRTTGSKPNQLGYCHLLPGQLSPEILNEQRDSVGVN